MKEKKDLMKEQENKSLKENLELLKRIHVLKQQVKKILQAKGEK